MGAHFDASSVWRERIKHDPIACIVGHTPPPGDLPRLELFDRPAQDPASAIVENDIKMGVARVRCIRTLNDVAPDNERLESLFPFEPDS